MNLRRLVSSHVTSSASIAAAITLVLAGCYGAAPPRPAPVQLPAVENGKLMDVQSRSTTRMVSVPKKMESCPQGHGKGSPACVVTTYRATEPRTHTTSRATLGGVPINIAQFMVLTEQPSYSQKLGLLSSLSTSCTRANIPRYTGIGLIGGGVGAMTFGASKKPMYTAGLIAAGAGLVSYALGYYAFGGKQCNEARTVYGKINHARTGDSMSAQGGATATDMGDRAARYNARQKQRSAATPP